MSISWYQRRIFACLLVTMTTLVFFGANTVVAESKAGKQKHLTVLDIKHAKQASVFIDSDNVVREKLPSTLFGFNINHYYFQRDLWNKKHNYVEPKIVKHMQEFDGALYRYPGGLVANRFWWEQAVGPYQKRKRQKIIKSREASKVLFGIDEYLEFVDSVNGKPWYVLNLVGHDIFELVNEFDSETIAKSNAELAKYILEADKHNGFPRYYQLGNELDRSIYQWSHQKYVERAKDTMQAVLEVDSEARFVAFLRDFDYKYKGNILKGNVSQYRDLIRDVLTGLPSVNDFSLHYYYDEAADVKKYRRISWRLKQFKRAIDEAKRVRKDTDINVWVTEHARGIDIKKGRAVDSIQLTSNLSAMLGTSDFLIALAQFPEIQGASWHGLNAGPWQLFDASVQNYDLRPRPVYWGMQLLQSTDLPVVLGTFTSSPNVSNYPGGYDIRAAAFTDDSREKLGLWMVNRSSQATEVEINYAPWNNSKVAINHSYISGKVGQNASDPSIPINMELDPKQELIDIKEDGSFLLTLPPSSVSSIILRQDIVPGKKDIQTAQAKK